MTNDNRPALDPQTLDEEDLLNYLAMLETIVHQTPQPGSRLGWAYNNSANFLLQHGVWYAPRPLPDKIARGTPKACFGNALVAAVRYGLHYVEGYANKIIPVEHAWCANDDGRLYEVTWPEIGVAYLGVAFSAERAAAATWNGHANVLWDMIQGNPLLQHPWTGEDFKKKWPLSPRIEQIRRVTRFANRARKPLLRRDR